MSSGLAMQALFPEYGFSGHVYSNRVAYICILSTLSAREEAETEKYTKVHVPDNLLYTLAYRKRHYNPSKVESKDQNPRWSSDAPTYNIICTCIHKHANPNKHTHRERLNINK